MSVMEKKTLPSAQEAVALIERAAAKHKHKKAPVVRVIENLDFGQGARQGDIYIMRLKPGSRNTFGIEITTGRVIMEPGKPWEDRQLTPGSGRGSRHFVVSEGCQLNHPKTSGEGRALFGPIIRAFNQLKVEHPEHDHLHMPPGDYVVIYQMDARTLQRVQD